MLDTPEDIERRVIEMMKTRTPSERLAMVSSMFHAGRTLALAGIRAQHKDFTPAQLRVALFRRMYGDDFSKEELARISQHLLAAFK